MRHVVDGTLRPASRAPKRILVTGGEGMLGSAISEQAVCNYPAWEVQAPGRHALDVLDPRAVMALRQWITGGWIVHCAATANVEECARQPQLAHKNIVGGTRNIIKLAEASGARLLYPQSCFIYDGTTDPIPETETPRPLSLYGKLKFESEKLVAASLKRPLIVRMAGFFGGESRDRKFVGAIVPKMRALVQAKGGVFEVGDRVWQPTWTRDAALNLLALIGAEAHGVYHLASHGSAAFYEVAEEIVSSMGWSKDLVIVRNPALAIDPDDLSRRPARVVLSCEKLKSDGLDMQRPWREALREYLATPFFQANARLEARVT